jgi:hypothetical protein
MIQPLDVQIARAVTPDQSVVCYAARDGLIKISPADRLDVRVHQLKARLPGFEPQLRCGRGPQKHQVAALRTLPVDHQPAGRHRALGEPDDPDDPDDEPVPFCHLRAYRMERPADVRDGTGPGRSAQRRQGDRRLRSQAAAGAVTAGIGLWSTP